MISLSPRRSRDAHMAFSDPRHQHHATPPEDRLSIRTFVLPFSEETVREAVDREIRRGGQVFFVHNRVQTLPAMERFLKETLPEVRIGVAHGQMDEEELALAMDNFASRRVDLLLCTAIIEADLPNANMILINQALHRSSPTSRRGDGTAPRIRILPAAEGYRDDEEARSGWPCWGADGAGRVQDRLNDPIAAGNRSVTSRADPPGGYGLTRFPSETMAEPGERPPREEEPEPTFGYRPSCPTTTSSRRGAARLHWKMAVSATVDAADGLSCCWTGSAASRPGPGTLHLSRLRVRMRSAGVRELKRGNGSLFLSLSDRSEVDRGLLVQWVVKDRKNFHFFRGEVLAMRIPAEDPDAVLAAAKNLLNRFPAGRSI